MQLATEFATWLITNGCYWFLFSGSIVHIPINVIVRRPTNELENVINLNRESPVCNNEMALETHFCTSLRYSNNHSEKCYLNSESMRYNKSI